MAKRARPRRQPVQRRSHRDWQDLLLLGILLVCVVVVGVGSALLLRASRTAEPLRVAEGASPQLTAAATVSLSAGPSTEAGEPAAALANTSATPPSVSASESVLGQLEGSGVQVTDGLVWAACEKAVFYWTLAPGPNGEASLKLRLREGGEAGGTVLVDEYATSLTQPVTGAALHALAGGEYTLSAEDVYSPWSVRVLCQDGEQPLSEAPDLAGSVSTVTPSFDLAVCNQLALLWSVEPDSGGRASMIVKMYIVGRAWPDVRVNETATGASEALSDVALFSVEAAQYFLVVEKVSGPWTIRWECRG